MRLFLARPPSTEVNESFLREVDENLRRDSVRDFFVENRNILIIALLLFLAAAGGTIWYREHQQAKTAADVEELAKINRQLSQGKLDQSAALKNLEDSSSKSVAATARFTSAAIAIEQGNSKQAIETYRSLAEDKGLAQPYRDIALIRQTAMEFDTLKPDQVIERMAPLAKPGEPWFGSAGELTGLAMIKQGKKSEAGRLFAAIARDKSVPESLRLRTVQMASSLGIDVSDAMPASAQ
jgi:hypothetical protein